MQQEERHKRACETSAVAEKRLLVQGLIESLFLFIGATQPDQQGKQSHAHHIEEPHYLGASHFFVILMGRARQSISLAKEKDGNNKCKTGLQRTAGKWYTWKVFFNCTLVSFQQQLCGLAQADLMCACTSDTRACTCLMCACRLQEKAKPQEALKGLEYITVWSSDWWCSIHYSELHWIINNTWWINKTCIWYWTAGIIPMCIFFHLLNKHVLPKE